MPDIKQAEQQIFLFLKLLSLSKCHDSALDRIVVRNSEVCKDAGSKLLMIRVTSKKITFLHIYINNSMFLYDSCGE
jgi:hypothetical protein